MVIVILGILAAIALQKFLDLSTEASVAAVKDMGGSIASATAVNFAGKKAGSASAQTLNQTNVCTAAILGGGLLPDRTGQQPEHYRQGNLRPIRRNRRPTVIAKGPALADRLAFPYPKQLSRNIAPANAFPRSAFLQALTTTTSARQVSPLPSCSNVK